MSIPNVPNLATAAGPVLEFERRILDAMPEIEHWFRQKWQDHTPPFYGSVDLRNAGFKLAPIDTNLFPGGFNNLAEDTLPCAVQAAQVAVERACPEARRLLLIPERHTRNVHYLTSVARLARILSSSGLDVRIGSVVGRDHRTDDDLACPAATNCWSSPSGGRAGAWAWPISIPAWCCSTTTCRPAFRAILQDLDPAQTMLPPLQAGWACAASRHHFACYDKVADEFAALVQVDPWMINPLFARCGQIDFRDSGEQCLPGRARSTCCWRRSARNTRPTASAQKPFVIVKADAGTYGMGIMTVHDAADVMALNRKQRNKMAVVQGRACRSPRSSSRKACPASRRSNRASPSRSCT